MDNKNISKGFSLIELCIVVTIGALMLAGGMAAWNGQVEKTKAVSTKDKLVAIERAMVAYVARSGRLPCPASRTAVPGQPAFGTATDCNDATIAAGNCSNGICVQNGRTYDHDNDPDTAAVPLRVRVGAVPARALSLPFDMIKDGYGRNFTYIVTEKMAASNADFAALGGRGAISIVDESGTTAIEPAGEAPYILLSHGADGKGATDFGSGQVVEACDADTSVGKDVQNCSPTSSDAVYRTAVYSSSNTADHFDDVLGYAAQITPASGNADGAASVIAAASPQPMTLWGVELCPAGWNRAVLGRRFEILGNHGGALADKEPQCIGGLSALMRLIAVPLCLLLYF